MEGKKGQSLVSKYERRADEFIDFIPSAAFARWYGDTMDSSNQKLPIVKSACSLLIDPCSGSFLRPLAGTHFQLVGKLVEFKPESEGGNPRITLGELGRRIGRAPKTLYCWIDKGWLRPEHGLKRINGRWLVEWPTFLESFEEGKVGRCS